MNIIGESVPVRADDCVKALERHGISQQMKDMQHKREKLIGRRLVKEARPRSSKDLGHVKDFDIVKIEGL